MKKNKVKKIFIVSFLALIAIIGIGITTNKIFAASPTSDEYTLKLAYADKEDGWKYYFKIYDSKEGTRYTFNGINLKYDKLDGYYVPIVDEKTNEVIDKMESDIIILSISEKYSDDILNINEFFNTKSFKSKITLSDLDDLSVNYIDKNELVKLFNNAITSKEYTKMGLFDKAIGFRKTEVKTDNSKLNGKYRIALTIDYGYITNLNIEYIDNKDQYLSSKINTNFEDKELLQELENIETDLINNINNNKKDYSSSYKMLSNADIKNIESSILKEINDSKYDK